MTFDAQLFGAVRPCPSCGTCPTCGRGFLAAPFRLVPTTPYIGDPIPNPWEMTGGTTGGSTVIW